MSYASMRDCANDLEKNGQLIRVSNELDPNLDIAEVHRRIYDQGGPSILFEKVKGSPFQAISNLYGTIDRTRFIFRHTLERVQKVVELKADPISLLKNPLRYLGAPFTALNSLPSKAIFSKPILFGETKISQLPQIKSWPMDGGAFVTLPQVYTEDPDKPGPMKSNLGMYRIQLSGNDYLQDEEIGLHYQLHRGIGVHHTRHNELGTPFKASVFVGGPPSHAFSAIMPLPEGLSELMFAGMLGGRRFGYTYNKDGNFLSTEADFVIAGEILKDVKKPEGPFGDHLGYYSLTHPFPVMKVNKVYHRRDPLWHFSVVGRPPQEDSSFGYLIHEIVAMLTPQEFPGLKELHAVDAAGVHPLLLAIGKERYMPFRDRKPEEILTIANRILGSGQTSLAKFLIIAADEQDTPHLDTHDLPNFFQHVLQRADWRRDLHFQTRTTIDTLDYSGSGWNEGSKVTMACAGKPIRKLQSSLPNDLSLPSTFTKIAMPMPGVLAISASPWKDYSTAESEINGLKSYLESATATSAFKAISNGDEPKIPLIVICDDAEFTAQNMNNFVWVTFTRANPSHDVDGVNASIENKHWGCAGALIIDSRIKKHHAPELVQDKASMERVDKLFQKGGALAKWG